MKKSKWRYEVCRTDAYKEKRDESLSNPHSTYLIDFKKSIELTN